MPIPPSPGLELEPSASSGIARVRVIDPGQALCLPWDRYVRLKAVADQVRSLAGGVGMRVLDVGGFDGALALFLPGMEIDLIDPATTGGAIAEIICADRAYDVVCAVDVLEHVEPSEREAALSECARVARTHLILNYPSQESLEAQALMLELTGNDLVRQHVEWPLPASVAIAGQIEKLGFSCRVVPHGSVAVWLGQYLAQHLSAEAGARLNRLLVARHAGEPFSLPLYHLVTASRRA